MKPDGFAADLYRKPEVLQRLAAILRKGNPWTDVVPTGIDRVILVGMGSSAYAGGVAAARMRARGIVAASELASSQLFPAWSQRTLVVATSASGGSAETLDALDRLPRSLPRVALTNTLDRRSPRCATPRWIWPPRPKSAGSPAEATNTRWRCCSRSNVTWPATARTPSRPLSRWRRTPAPFSTRQRIRLAD